MNIKATGSIFIILLLFLPRPAEARIYICVDEKGTRHYSDKKCPINKKLKTEVINNLGKAVIPDSILEFTPIIQIIKRTLTVINEQIPNNDLYKRALKYSIEAELFHNKFLTKRHKVFPKDYNPFEPVKLVNIIAAISHGCRSQAYMTICAAIEGNYWLNGEEQIYLKQQQESGLHYVVTEANSKSYCKKATIANQGGVVSHKIVQYFCQRENK